MKRTIRLSSLRLGCITCLSLRNDSAVAWSRPIAFSVAIPGGVGINFQADGGKLRLDLLKHDIDYLYSFIGAAVFIVAVKEMKQRILAYRAGENERAREAKVRGAFRSEKAERLSAMLDGFLGPVDRDASPADHTGTSILQRQGKCAR